MSAVERKVMTKPPKLSLIVFAFNEAESVASVLRELVMWLRRNHGDYEIVFVDDGSTDATLAAAEAELFGCQHRCVRHATNRGIGAAIKTGVAASRGEWITFMPADGQIEPEAIGTLWEKRRASEADVVLSVYESRDDGWHRKVLSAGVRSLITLVHGVRLRSDGPYLFRRSIFEPDDLNPDSFFLNFEFPIRVLAAGLQVETVVIQCRPRLAGSSKSAALSKVTRVAADLVSLRWRRAKRALSTWGVLTI